MRKALLLSVLFTLCSFFSQILAQEYDVSGVVQDTSGTNLASATVVLLQRADSVMVKFAITRENGTFSFPRVKVGQYLLQTTFVGYQSDGRHVDVVDADVSLGPVKLFPGVESLEELTVSADMVPMTVKQDTLEYNVNAFRVRPNANVEELLKRLPGIEVDSEGNIKAMGENVNKVLVEGKEFFGNDPKIATKNLPADAVDKVQLYDKLSDTAEFTGIDDGEREKTINLALKEDRKQGYFGKLSGGYGPDSRYEGRFNINRFSPVTQISVLGNMNNINEQGFSFNEYINFMGGIQGLMSGGGMMMIGGGGIPVGLGTSSGFRTTETGGINFNHDFNKQSNISLSYFLNRFKNDQASTRQREQFLADESSFLSTQDNNQLSTSLGHRFNLRAKHKFDESQDIQLRSSLSVGENTSASDVVQQTFGVTDLLENDGANQINSEGDNLTANGELTFRKRLAKPGRTFVTTASIDDGANDALTKLETISRFYAGALNPIEEILLQRQLMDSENRTMLGKIAYTEPVGQALVAELNVERRSVTSNENKDVFDIVGQDEVLNTLLTDRYTRDYTYNKAGANLRWNNKIHNISGGVSLQQSELAGNALLLAEGINKTYRNLLPSLNWRFSISQMRNITLRYNASVREPSVQELQPVTDNTNPLSLYTGNPDLTPEKGHSVNINYVSFDQFTFTNFFASVNIQYTKDNITQSRSVDENFRQIIKPVNAGDDWTVFGNSSFGTPLRALGAKINIETNLFYQQGNSVVNGDFGGTRLLRGTVETRLENRRKEVVDASIGGRITFNNNQYELNESQNQQYTDQRLFADVTMYLGGKWTITSGLDWAFYSEESYGRKQDVPIWRAEISRTLMDDRLTVQLSAYDILNRNLGITRTSTLDYIEDSRVQSLGRFILLRMTYSLTGFGGNTGPGGGVMIRTVER